MSVVWHPVDASIKQMEKPTANPGFPTSSVVVYTTCHVAPSSPWIVLVLCLDKLSTPLSPWNLILLCLLIFLCLFQFFVFINFYWDNCP